MRRTLSKKISIDDGVAFQFMCMRRTVLIPSDTTSA